MSNTLPHPFPLQNNISVNYPITIKLYADAAPGDNESRWRSRNHNDISKPISVSMNTGKSGISSGLKCQAKVSSTLLAKAVKQTGFCSTQNSDVASITVFSMLSLKCPKLSFMISKRIRVCLDICIVSVRSLKKLILLTGLRNHKQRQDRLGSNVGPRDREIKG